MGLVFWVARPPQGQMKEKNPSANEAKIMVGKVSQPSLSPVLPADDHIEKENHEKEKTEELLKAKDEMLQQEEEELFIF